LVYGSSLSSLLLLIAAAGTQSTYHPKYTSVYVGLGSGHWVQENKDGKVITMEDGFVWLISSYDNRAAACSCATDIQTMPSSR
jgi:hypothetical protein